MKIELHIIQSFVPSNLNRDDTGSPKDCEFGGVRRARISSQCWKRAMRERFTSNGIGDEHLSKRSRRVAVTLAKELITEGRTEELAQVVVRNALAGIGLPNSSTGDSEYLLFVSNFALRKFREACEKHWDLLVQQKPVKKGKQKEGDETSKQPKPEKLPKDAFEDLSILLKSGQAADLALFGRMLANKPDDNVNASTQVAHSISTHRSDLEFDYFTAVDDLQPGAETGAGMIGTVEFNAACFYRYLNVDVTQLSRNLDQNSDLVQESVEAVLKAAIEAVPSGKQNSTAAQNPPSFVLAVVRPRGLWSLANAFLKPVRAKNGGDLAEASIVEMSKYWKALDSMYGTPEGSWMGYSSLHEGAWSATVDKQLPIHGLIAETVDRAMSGLRT